MLSPSLPIILAYSSYLVCTFSIPPIHWGIYIYVYPLYIHVKMYTYSISCSSFSLSAREASPLKEHYFMPVPLQLKMAGEKHILMLMPPFQAHGNWGQACLCFALRLSLPLISVLSSFSSDSLPVTLDILVFSWWSRSMVC